MKKLKKYKIKKKYKYISYRNVVSDDETPLTAIKKFKKYKYVELY